MICDSLKGYVLHPCNFVMYSSDWQQLVTPNTEKLERGFLSFICQFRKAFIGDKPMANSKVYVALQQTLGLNEPTTQVMELVVKKM